MELTKKQILERLAFEKRLSRFCEILGDLPKTEVKTLPEETFKKFERVKNKLQIKSLYEWLLED